MERCEVQALAMLRSSYYSATAKQVSDLGSSLKGMAKHAPVARQKTNNKKVELAL